MSDQPQIVLARSAVVSPAELLQNFIEDYSNPGLVEGGVAVGGQDDVNQQLGGVALMDAGDYKRDLSGHLLHKRVQVRCLAGSLAEVDAIGNHLFDLIDQQTERIELSDASGNVWLVHGMSGIVGTSHHIDSTETWEVLFFALVTVGRDSLGTTAD